MQPVLIKLKSKLKNVIIPLKFKLITGFTVIVLLTGSISIISYITLKDSIKKLNLSVTAVITANEIIKPAGEIPGILTNYYVDKYKTDKGAILSKRAEIKNAIHLLKRQVKDENGSNELVTLDNLNQTYSQDITDAIHFIENRKAGEELTGQSDEIRKVYGYMKDSVQRFIAIELNHYQKLKAQEDRRINRVGVLILITIIAAEILTITGAIFFVTRLTGTISKLVHYSRNIADGDLQVKAVEIHTNDEIAILAQSFNQMGQNLRDLIGKIIESSNQVAHSAEFLKTSADQSAKASEQIAATIQQVSSGASEQSDESQKTAQVISELLAVNHKISERAREVLNIAGSASNAAMEGNEKVKGLINQIDIIEKEISSIQSVTDILKGRSEEIGEILQLITQMAEQTNLLSLNASIEAARASEYGRGFAVVADEIRKLSDGSSQAANDITKNLYEIRNAFMEVTEKMAAGVDEVRLGTQIAGDAKTAFEKIVDTSKDANSGIKDITEEIQLMVVKLTKVAEMSENIATIAEESSAGSQEVTAAAEEQTSSMGEILASVSKLSDMAEELQIMVQRFKL